MLQHVIRELSNNQIHEFEHVYYDMTTVIYLRHSCDYFDSMFGTRQPCQCMNAVYKCQVFPVHFSIEENKGISSYPEANLHHHPI